MKKILVSLVIMSGCVTESDNSILTDWCSDHPWDARCSTGESGPGGGGGGAGGGGGEACNTGTCPPGQRCYQRGLSSYCGLPPGTRCLIGQEPPGTRCYADINGWCQCFLTNPPPPSVSSEEEAEAEAE